MRPTLRQLEYLVALADALNFRRAAEACYVSQPALSAQIQQLEASLGVQLFERDRRSVLPTPAGVALTARARALLTATDELVAEASLFQGFLRGRLRLGVIPTIAPYLLPPALAGIREHHPELRLLIREDTTERLLEQLAQGDMDVLLLAREADLGDVTLLDVVDDPFWLAVPAGHSLAKRKSIRRRDLNARELILLEDGH